MRLGLLGEGPLVTGLAEALGSSVVKGRSRDMDLAVACGDSFIMSAPDDPPLLRCNLEFGHAILGPLEWMGYTGCIRCAMTRQRRAGGADLTDAEHERVDRLGRTAGGMWLTKVALATIAELVRFQAIALRRGQPPVTRSAVLRLSLRTLQARLHRFRPDPGCKRCGKVLAKRVSLEMAGRARAGSGDGLRIRSLVSDRSRLFQFCVDPEFGLVKSVVRHTGGFVATSTAHLARVGDSSGHIGIGREEAFDASDCVAIAEALERFAGLEPAASIPRVVAAYEDVADRALDPSELGYHAATDYARPDFPYRRFDPTASYAWVLGYSFQRRGPMLVPEHYAYYGRRRSVAGAPAFVYEISNGCAIGSCLEEATLHGLFEAIERDAFLMAWYTRAPLRRLEPTTSSDARIPLMVERIHQMTRYRVFLLNASVEFKVPVIWALAVDPADLSDRPRMFSAAGAHVDPERAALGALRELATLALLLPKRYGAGRERARAMCADPDQVREMDDHALLYCLPDAAARLDFFDLASQAIPFHQAFSTWYAQDRRRDLTDELRRVVTRLLHERLDVIVVDQTAPEQIELDLTSVKVIVPGLLPMTFGHRYRRIDGLPRLATVPVRLGYRERAFPLADINPHPHPFP